MICMNLTLLILKKEAMMKLLVISASHDVSAFPSRQEAYSFGAKTYGLGNMMIQECSLGALNKVRKFHYRVYRQ